MIRLRNIMLNLALCMMLMHVLVPHEHHTANQNLKLGQSSAEGILSLLASFFNEDLGERHLEDIRKSENLASCDGVFVYNFHSLLLNQSIIKLISGEFAADFQLGLVSKCSKRGPPQENLN